MAKGATNVQVVHEVAVKWSSGYSLAYQAARYIHPDGRAPEAGTRFIWKDPNGRLLPQRGQARIPSPEILQRLFQMARDAGWGDGWCGEDAKDVLP